MSKFGKLQKTIRWRLIILTVILIFVLFSINFYGHDEHEGVIKFSSDRSIPLISRCIDINSEKFHPRLTRIASCARSGKVNGYCVNGTTFVVPNGDLRVLTKSADGGSEIWIRYSGELSASTIDAATQCQ